MEFCCHCPEYPCMRYDDIDTYDSFISTRNLHENLKNIQFKGLEAYKAEMEEKAALFWTASSHTIMRGGRRHPLPWQ